jgi:hypothetical protein
MGCDVHAYVEYVDFETHDHKDYWRCLIQDAGGRDYLLFSLLADCGRGSEQPVVPNRGFPEGETSHTVFSSYHLLVVHDEYKGDEGYCSNRDADSWIASHSSEEVIRNGHRFVTRPDWHSPSWLTADELAQVIARRMFSGADYPYDVEWDAILAAMRALDERGKRSRLVFWFDN